MRKYILGILLIFTGIIFLVYNFFTNRHTGYAETLFSNESKTFEDNFDLFISSVENNILSIQQNFNEVDKTKDTTFIKEYLFPFLEKDPYLISIALINDSNKLVLKKEKKCIAFAIDSTKELDIVRWQRFENKKLISTWQESFTEAFDKTPWYVDLKKTPNQIHWLLKMNLGQNEKNPNNELFYAGYSYFSDDTQNLIIFQFSREKLLKNINTDSKKGHISFSIKSYNGKTTELIELKVDNDSLADSKRSHFKKFDESKAGTFSFTFNNETYWNSFKRYPKKTGIQYFLLTISENSLKGLSKSKNSDFLNKFALFLMVLGGIILLIKKRFFYIPSKRIKIPPANEILSKDESRYLEFKSSLRWDYRQEKTNPELEKVILKTLAAFGNTDGGILLIGVDDDKNIIGLENDFKTLKKTTADYYEIHLRNILHKHMGIKYVSKNIRMQFETCANQKIICAIKVLAANEPIYLKFKNKDGQAEEKFFVRSGNSSQEIISIAEINDYLNSRFQKQ